jgi:hypothetical protein
MTMDEPRTCGEGLAQRSALPARVSALTAAMPEVLETHEQTLDLTDDNARAEHIAYQQPADDYRRVTSQLRATADRTLGIGIFRSRVRLWSQSSADHRRAGFPDGC